MTIKDDMKRVTERMRSNRYGRAEKTYPTPATCGHSPDGVSTCVDHDCPCAKGQWERDKEKPDEPIAHPVTSFQQGSGGATQPQGEGSVGAVHRLKVDAAPLDALLSGAKTGEVRRDDRGFAVGDTVHLTCADGRGVERRITHIQRGYGLPEGICVLSYGRALSDEKRRAEFIEQIRRGDALSTSGAEARWIEDCDNACPACGGSGHYGDAARRAFDGPADFADYDAGLLNDFGGGDVNWWQDYLRAEIGRANEFWRDQVRALPAAGQDKAEVERLRGQLADAEARYTGSCRTIDQIAAERDALRAEVEEIAPLEEALRTTRREHRAAMADADALRTESDALRAQVEAMRGERDKWLNNSRVLLANIDWLAEILGEGPEDEDGAMVDAIRAALPPLPNADKDGANGQ